MYLVVIVKLCMGNVQIIFTSESGSDLQGSEFMCFWGRVWTSSLMHLSWLLYLPHCENESNRWLCNQASQGCCQVIFYTYSIQGFSVYCIVFRYLEINWWIAHSTHNAVVWMASAYRCTNLKSEIYIWKEHAHWAWIHSGAENLECFVSLLLQEPMFSIIQRGLA